MGRRDDCLIGPSQESWEGPIVCHLNEIVKVLDSTKLAKSISYVWIVVVVVASDQSGPKTDH